VRRAVANGYTGFAITIDTASYSRRERDLARRFVKPWRQRATGFDYQAGFTWNNIKRFKDVWPSVPLILKGIATGEDAALACEHGVDVVYVSNHGGRQLDQGAARSRCCRRSSRRWVGARGSSWTVASSAEPTW
jgi:glycolate oxidase